MIILAAPYHIFILLYCISEAFQFLSAVHVLSYSWHASCNRYSSL